MKLYIVMIIIECEFLQAFINITFTSCKGGTPLSVTIGASPTGSKRKMTADDLSKLQEELDAPNSVMKTIRKVS